MHSQARAITTNQLGVHPDLRSTLIRHKQHEFRRPIAQHTQQAFVQAMAWLNEWEGPLILDACCGVGESTAKLANAYRNSKVIGIDKSLSRLDKHSSYAQQQVVENQDYLLVQADLNDFWRLLSAYISESSPLWQLKKQFILYPNPYPKKSQLGKRWHASPVCKYILSVAQEHEVRSNWLVYLQEFLISAKFYGWEGDIIEIEAKEPVITPFERKYIHSGQQCFKLLLRPSVCDK